MGWAAFRAYTPNVPVNYTIPQALSRGDPCCEYVPTIGLGDGWKGKGYPLIHRATLAGSERVASNQLDRKEKCAACRATPTVVYKEL